MKCRTKKNHPKEYKEEKRSRRKMRRLAAVSGTILSVAAFAAGGLIVLGICGKYNLRRQNVSYAAGPRQSVQAVAAIADAGEVWEEGQIRYQGQNYQYNEDILTFLFMGIDKESGVKASGAYADGGQADALFLFVLNPHDETMTLIPIDRSTMTAIEVYDAQGNYEETVTAQICVQHGFGDGGKKSCEYQVKSVKNLFYGIPIHGYLAVDMDVIPDVTELVDGIDLQILEDICNGRQEVILRKGEQAHLDGEQVYWYVRDRDNTVELSAEGRLARQRQFLTVFIDKVKQMTGKDITIPIKIYNQIADKSVTDITVDEVTYLAATTGGYYFDAGQVMTIPGRSVSGEENQNSEYDEFYVDEKALYELILNVFYEPADER